MEYRGYTKSYYTEIYWNINYTGSRLSLGVFGWKACRKTCSWGPVSWKTLPVPPVPEILLQYICLLCGNDCSIEKLIIAAVESQARKQSSTGVNRISKNVLRKVIAGLGLWANMLYLHIKKLIYLKGTVSIEFREWERILKLAFQKLKCAQKRQCDTITFVLNKKTYLKRGVII